MGVMEWLKGKTTQGAGAPRVHAVTSQRAGVPIQAATGGHFRNGMWVRVFDKTGIFDDLQRAMLSPAELALANDSGIPMSVPQHENDGATVEVWLGKVVLTDADGLNQTAVVGDRVLPLVLYVPLAQVRQAYASELPAKRVSHLNAEQLHGGGYHATVADRRIAQAAGQWKGAV